MGLSGQRCGGEGKIDHPVIAYSEDNNDGEATRDSSVVLMAHGVADLLSGMLSDNDQAW